MIKTNWNLQLLIEIKCPPNIEINFLVNNNEKMNFYATFKIFFVIINLLIDQKICLVTTTKGYLYCHMGAWVRDKCMHVHYTNMKPSSSC
jgi:hypothetical protein